MVKYARNLSLSVKIFRDFPEKRSNVHRVTEQKLAIFQNLPYPLKPNELESTIVPAHFIAAVLERKALNLFSYPS